MKTLDQKLDELLTLSRTANDKIDRLGDQMDDLDQRLIALEQRMNKLGIKATVAGGIGGAITAIGIELIKAQFGG